MKSFKIYLENRDFSKKTITRNIREIERYTQWFEITYERSVESATKNQIINYLEYVKEARKLVKNTQNNVLKAIKNYHKFLAKEYDIPNISQFIKIKGIDQKRLRPLFTLEELDLLCDAYYYHIQEYQPNNRELYHYPNYERLQQGRYIALTLIAYQGLHIGEVERLRKEDFDFVKATVKIHASRLSEERTLKLDACQIGVLMQFFHNDTPIVPNRNQFERLSDTLKTLHYKFEDLSQLRTSKIVLWVKEYNLRKAQVMAGHKKIDSTEKYLANDIEDIKNDFDHFHPLN